MRTELGVKKDTELYRKGQELIKAAHEYWEEYRKYSNPSAVVWLEAENGNFVLFTRGEYKKGFVDQIWDLRGEPPLERPFEA